jgi:hypothetical protein
MVAKGNDGHAPPPTTHPEPPMRHSSRAAGLALAALLAGTVAAAPGADSTIAADPEPEWAPAATATIKPGVQIRSPSGGQCTPNFIFIEVGTDEDGNEVLEDVLIGMAAHCGGTDGNTATNGCTAGTIDLGSQFTISGATQKGTMTYNSWGEMKQAPVETRNNVCAANDFALVSVHPDDWARINPSLPFWGGPMGIAESVPVGSDLYTYGNSGLRFGIQQLSPKVQVKAASASGGWSHTTYAVSPGVPGDSGSGHVDNQGRAFGVTSTLILLPFPGGNGISDLGRALDYARVRTGNDYRLVNGTEPFSTPIP